MMCNSENDATNLYVVHRLIGGGKGRRKRGGTNAGKTADVTPADGSNEVDELRPDPSWTALTPALSSSLVFQPSTGSVSENQRRFVVDMLRHAPRWVSTTVSDDFQKAMANAVYTAMHGYVHDLHRLYSHVSDHCERVAAHHKLCSRDIAHDLREMWDRQACLGRELEEMRSHNALLRRTVVQMADDIHKCKQQLQDMRRRSTSQSALGTCQEPGSRTARTRTSSS